MARIRILDLDNCISDDAWRIPRIRWQHADLDARYHDYHSLAPFDALGNGDLLATEDEIAVFTARPTMFRAATEEWLKRQCVSVRHLIMRNEHNHMPSVALKDQQLRWLLAHYDVRREEISIAFDDREDVVAMYRARGFRAEVRKIHDLCAMTPPKSGARLEVVK